jgi:hypothetical protein
MFLHLRFSWCDFIIAFGLWKNNRYLQAIFRPSGKRGKAAENNGRLRIKVLKNGGKCGIIRINRKSEKWKDVKKRRGIIRR